MNRILNKKETQELIIKTLGSLDSLVKTTYGPYGQNVLISNLYEQVYTKDGLSVISAVYSEDQVENNIIQEFISLIRNINDINLDGSTTASILTYALLKAFSKPFNCPPQRLKELILLEIPNIINLIHSLSKEAREEDKEEILKVILNNNKSISKLIPSPNGEFSYEILKDEEDKIEEFRGFKNNTTFNYNPYTKFNGRCIYIREFSSYQNIYLSIRNYLENKNNKKTLLVFKRLPSDTSALDLFLKQLESNLNMDFYAVGSLLPPKDSKQEVGYNYITHSIEGDITLTKDSFYVGNSTHYKIFLNALNSAEFKQKKDAIDDAFSIIKLKNYIVGGGYIFYKIIEYYKNKKLSSEIEKEIINSLIEAFEEPIKTLAQQGGIKKEVLDNLYESNFIYNFAERKKESIKKTKVKESTESLENMINLIFRYLSNFVTIGSIIKQ